MILYGVKINKSAIKIFSIAKINKYNLKEINSLSLNKLTIISSSFVDLYFNCMGIGEKVMIDAIFHGVKNNSPEIYLKNAIHFRLFDLIIMHKLKNKIVINFEDKIIFANGNTSYNFVKWGK